MNIYPWFNSEDIASYVRDSGRHLDAAEMIYIVYQNKTMTLERKFAALKEIAQSEPDCEVRGTRDERWPSAHDFIYRYIALQQKKLDLFENQNGFLFYPKRVRWGRVPDCFTSRPESLWSEGSCLVFSSVDKCIQYLREEYVADDEASYDRFEIGRTLPDHPDSSRDGSESLMLDGNFELLSVETDGLSEEESDIEWLLSDHFLRLPCPFNRGDIVIDVTDPDASPFVFDMLDCWDAKERAAHGICMAPVEAARLDAGIARRNERNSWDCSAMIAQGYQLAARSNTAVPFDHHGCVYYDTFGACDNYLNLGFYKKPLKGEERLLGIISQHVKGKLDIEAFLNFAQLINLDAHASALKHSFDFDYDVDVQALYRD